MADFVSAIRITGNIRERKTDDKDYGDKGQETMRNRQQLEETGWSLVEVFVLSSLGRFQ